MLKRTHYTLTPSAKTVTREVFVIDAKGQKLGRIATSIATKLIGKHKVNYTTNIDMGDYVVIKNAALLDIAQKRTLTKEYKTYSGYQGGQKSILMAELMKKDATEPLRLAIKGMIPDNKLKTERLKRLFVFAGEEVKLPPEVQKLVK